MKKYHYWSNKPGWHDKELYVVSATDINLADEAFQNATDINPSKNGWVSVTIDDPRIDGQ